MSEEAERGPEILNAHQELVQHIEQGTSRIRALSIVTIIVAALLAISYASQLVLPLAGTSVVTVNLSDPANIGTELVVLALALVWLYVGVRDLRFSWRMKGEIRAARSKEKEIQEKIQ
jgi:hypothetical protein